ncbi:aminofutalosine synthase MqnE [Pasteuria penetrans]|uniref:aminofutalosine synthase MqnE n=1 Tax=Pasteuria penetrans TaxID=86005 RepID=UPI000FC19212|nr:aminofutalosine synthase MqnE [Pasteuria penetrans]
METSYATENLETIRERILSGNRLSLQDGLDLYACPDLMAIAQLADHVNQKRNNRHVYFIQNLYINPTNVCEASCSFCAFRRDADAEGAYTMNEEELLHYTDSHYHEGIKEFHIVGGHNTEVSFDYYVHTLTTLKKHYPKVTLKAYTAAEIVFFCKQTGWPTEKILETLMAAGLETLPGGGAEILTERYRSITSPDKASTEEWLDVHRTAHRMGMYTHATMLYGGIESYEERILHMLRIRNLQDDTGGFLVFIPLAMQPRLKTASIRKRTSAMDDLKTIAISRLMLDNIPHIKAYFINIGTQLAQLATHCGADDLHGTLMEERISQAAGSIAEKALTTQDLIWLIRGAQRIPVERDTFYRTMTVHT